MSPTILNVVSFVGTLLQFIGGLFMSWELFPSFESNVSKLRVILFSAFDFKSPYYIDLNDPDVKRRKGKAYSLRGLSLIIWGFALSSAVALLRFIPSQ